MEYVLSVINTIHYPLNNTQSKLKKKKKNIQSKPNTWTICGEVKKSIVATEDVWD